MKWLQLSDIHFISNFDLGRCRDALVKFLRKEIQGINFVIITGDITDKNSPYNYNIKDFLEKIAKASGIEEEYVIISPGNHDICRNIQSRNTIIGGIQNYASNPSNMSKLIADTVTLKILHQGYKNYEDFFSTTKFKWQSLENSLIDHLPNINLIYLSTCTLSCKNNEEGSLGINLDELQGLLGKMNENIPTIAFGHHSLDCLFPACKQRIVTLFDDYDIRLYMCGHYHIPGQSSIDISDYKIQEIISGSLSNNENETPSIFIYDIDDTSLQGYVQSYIWINDSSIWGPNVGYNRNGEGKKKIDLRKIRQTRE